MYHYKYTPYWERFHDEFQKPRRVFDARSRALHVSQIKEVYHKSSKIADLVYIQGVHSNLLEQTKKSNPILTQYSEW